WIVSRIAKRLGVSHTTVRRTLKEFDRKTKARDKEAFLRWRTRDYDAILERIREQQRSLTVVCRDPDLPSLKAWISFSEKHPEYAEKLREVYHGMPYSFQSRFGALSPRFRADCERLRAEGMSYKKIAETLGVGSKPVIRVLRERDQKHPRKK
ncbi:MAG: hypothetical protein GY859_11830, partial [Desulfobacterales bacterium]|nr:hypothetical protein [Desulfobacterales bacterium]